MVLNKLLVAATSLLINQPGFSGEGNTVRIGETPHQNRTFVAGISGVAVSGKPVMDNTGRQIGIQGSPLCYKDNIQDMARRKFQQLRPVPFR